MAKSQTDGNSSSSPNLLNRSEEYLRSLSKSPLLSCLIDTLQPDGDLHFVGGTVRDSFIGTEKTDIDLATILKPEEVLKRLEAANIKVIPTGLHHGTVMAVIDGEHIEITTFRLPGTDGGYANSIDTDLGGRDFTINAIAFSITQEKLIDTWNGIADLKNSVLRAVGDPTTRFLEDPLRLLRMIRFGPASGLKIEATTKDAAITLANKIHSVSVERIRTEIEKISLSSHAADGFRVMNEVGLLKEILPEFVPMVGCEQNSFHIHDVFEHTLSVLEKSPQDRILRLSALFHDSGKPHTISVGEDGERHFYLHEKVSREITESVMERLKFSKDDIASVATLVGLHMRPLDCGPQGVRRLMRDLGPLFESWLVFKRADATPKGDPKEFETVMNQFLALVNDEKERTKGSVYGKLAIDGYDLIELGMKPGKDLGDILKQIEEMVIENPDLNDKESLRERAIKLIAELGGSK